MFCFSNDKKIQALVHAAPDDKVKLKEWVNHCTAEMQQELLKYCKKVTNISGAQKERKDIIKLLLKHLPILKTVENAQKFLTETEDESGNNILWKRLQTYPLNQAEFRLLFHKVKNYQNSFVKAKKLQTILSQLTDSTNQLPTNLRFNM